MKIRIHVTKAILMRSMFCPSGEEKCKTNCAIALAVRDILPKAMVELFDIYPYGCYHDEEISLPDEAISFISDFDSNSPERRILMKPFSFEIDVPDSIIERIGISEVERILSESTTLERV